MSSFPHSPDPARSADVPLASVLITNHNYGRYLAAAIDSALCQTYSNVEIIVVDDGSTDGSREILAQYEGRIKTILQPQGGQPSAFNAAFAASKGTYVFPCDSDDVFEPDKITRLIALYRDRPRIGWIYHELDYIDGGGRALPIEALGDAADVEALRTRRTRFAGLAELDFRELFASGRRLPYTCPAMSGLTFTRAALNAILPMPESISAASDEYPKFAALALFPGAHVGEPLARQRLHDANAATVKQKDQRKDALRHLRTAYHLRRKIERVGPSTDRWFANALGILIATAGARAAFATPEVRLYLQEHAGFSSWIAQAPRVALGFLRSCR